ncbi:hypothetical protein K3G63_19830 [Hymenobacter sp. HSC-4F20]|uniref:hypothetical protein n=1 Tax=Hymenobacter sp. HSC-4F20 TaxID=2864135 RepID=UPI001C7389EF|nr:hypothetical protein [Hymenobacter sp. HSC-4F20]MBX0292705.1 hypothetical protein [Hymenobacter sp. HSC-4F20]
MHNSPGGVIPSDCFFTWYEPEHRLLQVQWRPLSSPHQAKDCLLEVLQQVQNQRVQQLLLNLDGMPELSALDCYLLETSYLLALPLLPLRQVALVLTSYMQHQLLLEITLHQPPFEIQVFDDAHTAREWLRHPSALETSVRSVHHASYKAA